MWHADRENGCGCLSGIVLGGRIAPLDTFQHVVPGGITFLTKICTSHAADVCRPLSLFLLLLHNSANSTT